ncbi:MAG: hypothetical protein QM621_14780 [Aeromicrobium sp.]|uniref:hypothetical protein n=1 Tax=Aeromicrobium sp. TaxID=1871063 RepID=UPI0039E40F17
MTVTVTPAEQCERVGDGFGVDVSTRCATDVEAEEDGGILVEGRLLGEEPFGEMIPEGLGVSACGLSGFGQEEPSLTFAQQADIVKRLAEGEDGLGVDLKIDAEDPVLHLRHDGGESCDLGGWQVTGLGEFQSVVADSVEQVEVSAQAIAEFVSAGGGFGLVGEDSEAVGEVPVDGGAVQSAEDFSEPVIEVIVGEVHRISFAVPCRGTYHD